MERYLILRNGQNNGNTKRCFSVIQPLSLISSDYNPINEYLEFDHVVKHILTMIGHDAYLNKISKHRKLNNNWLLSERSAVQCIFDEDNLLVFVYSDNENIDFNNESEPILALMELEQ